MASTDANPPTSIVAVMVDEAEEGAVAEMEEEHRRLRGREASAPP